MTAATAAGGHYAPRYPDHWGPPHCADCGEDLRWLEPDGAIVGAGLWYCPACCEWAARCPGGALHPPARTRCPAPRDQGAPAEPTHSPADTAAALTRLHERLNDVAADLNAARLEHEAITAQLHSLAHTQRGAGRRRHHRR